MPTLQIQESPAHFTVFAPTNDAFVDLLRELGVDGLEDIPADVLSAALSYHVVTGTNVRVKVFPINGSIYFRNWCVNS